MTYFKMLIVVRSPNTKQCPARLSPPPVKLGSFIGGKSPPSPQKGRELFMILDYYCVWKSKELYDLRYESNNVQYIPNF